MMFNPFVLFRKQMIEGFIKMNHCHLVTQQVNFDKDPDDNKIHLLLTDYGDGAKAHIHFNALMEDNRGLLDLNNTSDRKTLEELIQNESTFALWAAFVQDPEIIEKRLNKRFSAHMRNYIELNTNWQIGGSNRMQPKLQVIFGELFVSLKFNGQSLRIKMTELETYRYVL